MDPTFRYVYSSSLDHRVHVKMYVFRKGGPRDRTV